MAAAAAKRVSGGEGERMHDAGGGEDARDEGQARMNEEAGRPAWLRPVSASTTPAEPWGQGCAAWRLLREDQVQVAEETMPPGTAEVAHHHEHARQFFYVLVGALTMRSPRRRDEHDCDGDAGDDASALSKDVASLTLEAGDGLFVPPGMLHQAVNESDEPVTFLVITVPGQPGDRVDAAAPETA
ncbi:MAG: cupin domain-containing protein [Pseudomonadota bacterium]